MRRIAQHVFLSILALLVTSSVLAQGPIHDLKPTVILVSLDGFRYDYVDRFHPPTLTELARKGVKAKWMTPSFPTKTFPNHYTIVTGLYPEHHGIVENNIYDLGEVFGMGDRVQVRDPKWWWGEPIWVTAEKQGQRASSYFWPGSEAKIENTYATYWRAYNGRVPNFMRVDELLHFLDQPVEKRPTMLVTYFSTTDDVGHEFGPDSKEIGYAVLEVDTYIKRLVDGLKARRIYGQANIIIVADHGMSPYNQQNAVIMDDYFDTKDKSITEAILTTGEIWQIFPKAGKENWIMDRLAKIQHATCWRKKDIPERLHYNEGRRVAPIVCSVDEGWYMTDRDRFERDKKMEGWPQIRGGHGYDNKYPEMRATFIAHGGAFKRGYVADDFPNIDVYNLMCKILGLKPAKNDGDFNRVKKMLR